MAEKKKTCPLCHKEIPGSSTVCPQCKAELEVLVWDVETSAGRNLSFHGSGAVAAIRDALISGEIKLSHPACQRIEVLAGMQNDQHHFVIKKKRETKPLKHYASKEFALQVLFAPVKAYGKRCAKITWVVVGVSTALVWNAYGLVLLGSHPLTAALVGALMLVSLPTIILAVPVFLIAQKAYNVPVMALTMRTFFSFLYGAIVGAAVGWTLGYLVGVVLGARKRPLLSAD